MVKSSGDSLVFAGLAKKIGRFFTSSSRPPIPVKAGQVIGRVVRNTSHNRSSMLHIEMFANDYCRKPPWMKGTPNPHRGLYDPSLALLKLARCGKRGSGGRKLVAILFSPPRGEHRSDACSTP